jgi:predicted nucleic acid-binding protein
MRAVSNTSPISNLAIIGRLDLLRRRYGTVLIPPAVHAELSALSHPAARLLIQEAFSALWLVVRPPAIPLSQVPMGLDPGESEAIALALGVRADVLLMDERRGRGVARARGLVVAGILGELLYAKRAGELVSLSAEIKRLRTDAGFFVDSEIERFILSQSGEAVP